MALGASQNVIGVDMNRLQRDKIGRFLHKNQVARKHSCIQYWKSGKLPPGRQSIALRKELKAIRQRLEELFSGQEIIFSIAYEKKKMAIKN